MRDILFKAKRMSDGKWIEGSLVHYESGETAIFEEKFTKYGCEATEIGKRTMVDPNTICQYTGLTDKNGKKVFEGDILKFIDGNVGYEWTARVEFGNPNAEYNWGFQLVCIKGPKPNTDILLWFDAEETCAYSEVIGNIFDNPELLKGVEE